MKISQAFKRSKNWTANDNDGNVLTTNPRATSFLKNYQSKSGICRKPPGTGTPSDTPDPMSPNPMPPVAGTPDPMPPVVDTPVAGAPDPMTPVDETPVAGTPDPMPPVVDTPVAGTPNPMPPVVDTPVAGLPNPMPPVDETPVAGTPNPIPPVAGTPDPTQPPQSPISTPELSPEIKAITDKNASFIALDTDTDGLGTINLDGGVQFDIFNTGTPTEVGWISPDDAILTLDVNGSGTIDNGAELFGGGIGKGFAQLGTFDSNGDKVIDAQDADFGKLSSWQDANSNATTDPGELLSLADAGITSIDLNTENSFTMDGTNVIGETTKATSENGPFDVASVYFAAESAGVPDPMTPVDETPVAGTPDPVTPVVDTPVAGTPNPIPPVAGVPDPTQPPQSPISTPELSPEIKAITDKNASFIGLDPDTDGLGTIGIDAGIKFDIFNNGTPTNVGWISPDDAILTLDVNGSGTIDNGAELFGGGIGKGFAQLGTFDSNGDKVIDANDADFGKLSSWNDANGNAITDPGELLSLSDASITSIDLNTDNTFTLASDGSNNVIGESTKATAKNSDPFDVASVYFAADSDGVSDPMTPVDETPVAGVPNPMTPVDETPVAGVSDPMTPVDETPVAGVSDPMTPVDETPVAGVPNPTQPPQLTIPTPELSPEVKAITDKNASVIGVDTDADGLGTIGLDAGIKFDIFNTGTPTEVGWISGDDALLALDANGNGTIDNGAEVFGGGVGEGFAKLGTFDSNGDKVIDAQDADFGKLSVWSDSNRNAITESGELASLLSAGITSIDLKTDNTFTLASDAANNVIGEKTTATSNSGPFDVASVYFPS